MPLAERLVVFPRLDVHWAEVADLGAQLVNLAAQPFLVDVCAAGNRAPFPGRALALLRPLLTCRQPERDRHFFRLHHDDISVRAQRQPVLFYPHSQRVHFRPPAADLGLGLQRLALALKQPVLRAHNLRVQVALPRLEVMRAFLPGVDRLDEALHPLSCLGQVRVVRLDARCKRGQFHLQSTQLHRLR